MNYNLLFVEMQRSVYLREYYPQTKKEYRNLSKKNVQLSSLALSSVLLIKFALSLFMCSPLRPILNTCNINKK